MSCQSFTAVAPRVSKPAVGALSGRPSRSPEAWPSLRPLAWTIEQAAQLLNVPTSWLRDKVTAKAVPHTSVGRHKRLTDDHLAQILAAGEVTPQAPPEPPRRGRRRAL